MVLESLVNPWRMERRPLNMVFIGALYASLGLWLALWVFESYASLVMVFLTTMAAIPLIYNTIKYEETKDLQDMQERFLIKEHWKALSAFMWLFVGSTLAFALWYIVLSVPWVVGLLGNLVPTVFSSQTEAIAAINGQPTGAATSAGEAFRVVFVNNFRVMVFCILFSFLYGSGAIFILIWNASVIGTAIGGFFQARIGIFAQLGSAGFGTYLQGVGASLLRYAIHGLPEILAYFTAALAGGIISIAVIRHDFGTQKFEHIILDSADLLLLSVAILVGAAVIEVYLTPRLF